MPTTPPLPEGFVPVFAPLDDSYVPIVTCGDFTIENKMPSGASMAYEPFVVAKEGGKTIYEAQGRRYTGEMAPGRQALVAEVCGDLTGDGVPELILTERTIGAHCCYTYYVVSLTTPAKRLLMWEKGDSGDPLVPIKVKPGKTWQLISHDRIFPPFDPEQGDPSVAYAFVPGYPIVFDLAGGEYVKRTFQNRAYLSDMRQKDRDACAGKPDCGPDALYAWGLSLIIGDWDKEKANIVPDPEERKPFERRAAAMLQLLRKRL